MARLLAGFRGLSLLPLLEGEHSLLGIVVLEGLEVAA